MTVVIVDDDAGVGRLLEMLVEEAGHEAVVATHPDVVLQAERMRQRNPQVRTLFLSGYFPSAELRNAVAQNSRTIFLQKPFHPDEFFSVFAQLVVA